MRALLLVTPLVAACQSKAELRPVEVVLRDQDDAAVLTLTRTATGCTAEPGALVITVGGGLVQAGEWQLGPGPVGRELRSASGTLARVVEEAGPPRRLSLIDPIGVPMVRLVFDTDKDTVTAMDAARATLGRIERTSDGVRFVADDKKRGVVTGEASLEVAARLLAPATLPPVARALLACERLVAPSPVK